MKKTDKMLEPWVKSFEADLSDETKQLIADANFDLYYGDGGTSDDYPGFTTACKRIKEALEDVPSQLWVDAECNDCWTDTKPSEYEDCVECDGTGEDENGEPGALEPCIYCDGSGKVVTIDVRWLFDRRDLIKAIVGNELAEYVR